MKTQIRNGIFETNSSSVHSISISNSEGNYCSDTTVIAKYGSFGWENEIYDDINSRLSYLWSAICDFQINYTSDGKVINYEAIKEWENIIQNALKPFNIDVQFMYNFESEYGIDHYNELYIWLNDLKGNPQMIADFILNNDSYVSTGNDNGMNYEYYPEDKPTDNEYYEFSKYN